MMRSTAINAAVRLGLGIACLLALAACGSNGDGFLEPGMVPAGLGPTLGDTTPPVVLSTVPEANAAGIRINSTIKVQFSEYMTQATVAASIFSLKDASNNSIAATVAWDGTSATFTPATYLSPNTMYTATLTGETADSAGIHMTGPYSWNFTTNSSADVAPPAVISTSPGWNTSAINPTTALVVTFSEPMDPLTINGLTFTLTSMSSSGGPVSGTVSCNGTTATFTPLTALAPKTGYHACITTAATDLNGNRLPEEYCWYFSTEFANSGLFNTAVSFPVGAEAEAVAIGDVNGDGRNDVVAVSQAGSAAPNLRQLFVFTQSATGSLSPVASFKTSGASCSVAICDINNDGKNEVVVANDRMNIEVFTQDGSGGLVSHAIYTTINSTIVKIADLNHDGLLDVVGIGWGTDSADVFLQNANGSLDPPTRYAVDHAGWDDLAVGDVNNDGLVDIIVKSGQGLNPKTAVLTQKADGTFNSPVYYGPAGDIAVGDVTGDGRDDVVVATNGICVLAQNTLGALSSSVCYTAAVTGGSIEVADINQDGKKDVVILYGESLGVYLQAANGSMLPQELYTVPSSWVINPDTLAVGDINGDGRIDVVTVSTGVSQLNVLYHK